METTNPTDKKQLPIIPAKPERKKRERVWKVTFRAYDKTVHEYFELDSTDEFIHKILKELCHTYHILSKKKYKRVCKDDVYGKERKRVIIYKYDDSGKEKYQDKFK